MAWIMRPTHEESEAAFWEHSRRYWIGKADKYARWGLKADFLRCMNRVELAELRLLEANGEILVYGPEIYLRTG